MRKETRYFHELEDGREVEIPFNIEGADITEVQTEGKILLGCIVRDLDPSDPLEEFDDGTLVQFDRHSKHYGMLPELGDFKDIIRENKGRVFYVDNRYAGYSIGQQAAIKNARDIKDADGYYISPKDVKPGKQAASYAAGAMEQYTAWCEGDVWGVCVWEYDTATLELIARDECWGCYGTKYAEQELKNTLETTSV
jgi:hypothetical protein